MKLSRILIALCLITLFIVQSASADRRRLNRFSELVVSGGTITIDATVSGVFNAGNATGFEVANGTDLPDSPLAGYMFLDTNDGACDDANDSGGTAVCLYNGSAWILLGNTGS